MAQVELLPEEIEYLKSKGIDPSTVTAEIPDPPMSKGAAVAKTAKAHGGSWIGGGAGAAGGWALGAMLAPETGGLSLAVPIGASILGAIPGAYAGGKAQEAVLPEELNARLQQEAAAAQEQHPVVSALTDITGAALAGGGKPSLSNLGKAGRALVGRGIAGDSEALANVALQAGINPAIEAGTDIAQGRTPDPKSLAISAAGGALFSGQSALGRKMYGGRMGEPAPEPTTRIEPEAVPIVEETPKPVSSPFMEKVGDKYVVPDKDIKVAYKQHNPPPEGPKDALDAEGYKARALYRAIPTEQMRNELHESYLKSKIAIPETTVRPPEVKLEPAAEPTTKVEPAKVPVTESTIKIPESTEKTPWELNLEREIAERNRKLEDFRKASEEAALQKSNEVLESAKKPGWTANQERILPIDPNNLIGTAITRPEVREGPLPTRETRAQKGLQDELSKSIETKGQQFKSNYPIITDVNEVRSLEEGLKAARIIHEFNPSIPEQIEKVVGRKINQTRSDSGSWSYGPDIFIALKEKFPEQSGYRIEQHNGHLYVYDDNPLGIPGANAASLKNQAQLNTQLHTLSDGNTVRLGATAEDERLRIASSNSVASELMRTLKLDELSQKVPIRVDPARNRSAYVQYRDGSEEIVLTSRDAANPITTAEEIIHAATVRNFPQELHGLTGADQLRVIDNYIANGPSENVRELFKCYKEVAKQKGLEDVLWKDKHVEPGPHLMANPTVYEKGVGGVPDAVEALAGNLGYPIGDPFEFTAHALKNKQFQRMLNEMDNGLGDGKSLWSRFINAIRNILGMDVKQSSMLERVIKHAGELAEEPRPGSEKIASESRAQKDKAPIPQEMRKRGFSFFPFLTSRIDKIAVRHNDPTGHMAADALHKFEFERSHLEGKYGNRFIQLVDSHKLTPEQVTNVYKYNHEVSLFEKSGIKLSPAEASLSADIKKFMRDIGEDVQKNGPHIRQESGGLREIKLKEAGYFPSIIGHDVVYEWQNNAHSPKALAQDQAYIAHLVKNNVEPAIAKSTLADYKSALANRMPSDTEFNAIRKAEGYGLPWELVDKNINSAAMRYARRAAKDVAYFKHIQNLPKIRKALNVKDENGQRVPDELFPEIQPLHSDEVTDALRSVNGLDRPRNPTVMAAARAAANTVMGIGTAARNVMTIPGIAATYMQTGQLHFLAKAVNHLNDSKARALASNAVKPNFQEAFDAAGYVVDNPNPVIRMLDKYSSFMRKYQGRDLSNQIEGEYLYSLGELLATDNIAKAQQGNIESRRFVQRFGDVVNGSAERLFKGNITPEDVQKVAKRFVDATRGTYSAEGLPSWAIEGELAPFAALSKFAIEKSNTVWKDVIEPARQGIYGPLLRYALGSLGVGALIEQMNEMLTNKRGPDATINETMANLTPENGLAKAIGLLQLGSFAGIVGDGAKAAMQMYQGKELRYNQPLSMPLYTLVTDTLMGNMSDAADAITEGQDPFEVLGTLATNIAGQSVQTMRYADANFFRPEEAKRKEKFRDVRVFQQLEGAASGPPIKSNPYMDADAKEFKRSGDPAEAMKMLPPLLHKIVTDSKDPYEMRKRLSGLKSNSYQTMPNMDTMPLQFLRYIQHLKMTQGEEAASERLNDYMRQNMINRMKSSAVP